MKDSIEIINESTQEMGIRKDEVINIMETLSAISEENAAGTQGSFCIYRRTNSFYGGNSQC